MEFTSTPVPYHGAVELQDAKNRAVRHAEATAERFGYGRVSKRSYEVTGDEEGGTVIARVETHPVRHLW